MLFTFIFNANGGDSKKKITSKNRHPLQGAPPPKSAPMSYNIHARL